MEKEYRYRIASHSFRVVTDGKWCPHHHIDGFLPFVLPQEECDKEPLFTLRLTEQKIPFLNMPMGTKELHRFEFEGIQCTFACSGDELLFSMVPEKNMAPFFFRTRRGSRLIEAVSGFCPPSILGRFILWTAFGLSALPFQTVAIHASAICHHGQAVLFLGESGTGKSTHTRLWRTFIPGSALLNDDSPIVRMEEGNPLVYGSPWSGKTPCYRTDYAPLAAIVRLRQAPENRITRLSSIAALGALLPSCPPLFAYDHSLMDHISHTLSGILSGVPVYYLDCRPDEEAVRLVFSTLFPDFSR